MDDTAVNEDDIRRYQAPPDLLAGRVVLVTGAGGGIGRAAALAYARHGATVVLLDNAVPALEGAYDDIEAAGGPQPAIYPLDLMGATPDDYAEMARTIESSLGRVDGVLSNAAVLGDMTPVDLYPPESWAKVLQVNLNGPFLLIQALLPLLRKAPDASILLTTAEVGRRGRAYWGAYAAAAAGLENLGQVLAHELDNTAVRVNAIDPGPVRTALRKRAYPGENPARLAAPEDIMPAYLFLMGPASMGLTGMRFSAQAAGRQDPAATAAGGTSED